MPSPIAVRDVSRSKRLEEGAWCPPGHQHRAHESAREYLATKPLPMTSGVPTAASQANTATPARSGPSSPPSQTGMRTGAEAAGVAATLLGMRDGIAPPTINLENPDPECDLDYIANQARPLDFEYALANCIAFGSKNSALVLRKL